MEVALVVQLSKITALNDAKNVDISDVTGIKLTYLLKLKSLNLQLWQHYYYLKSDYL